MLLAIDGRGELPTSAKDAGEEEAGVGRARRRLTNHRIVAALFHTFNALIERVQFRVRLFFQSFCNALIDAKRRFMLRERKLLIDLVLNNPAAQGGRTICVERIDVRLEAAGRRAGRRCESAARIHENRLCRRYFAIVVRVDVDPAIRADCLRTDVRLENDRYFRAFRVLTKIDGGIPLRDAGSARKRAANVLLNVKVLGNLPTRHRREKSLARLDIEIRQRELLTEGVA